MVLQISSTTNFIWSILFRFKDDDNDITNGFGIDLDEFDLFVCFEDDNDNDIYIIDLELIWMGFKDDNINVNNV